MMSMTDPLLLSWVALGLCALAIGLGHWWHTRKLNVALRKLEKLDRARRAAGQYATQTRQQLEQLSSRLGKTSMEATAAAPDARIGKTEGGRDAPLANWGRPVAAHRPSDKPELPSSGFADTMVV